MKYDNFLVEVDEKLENNTIHEVKLVISEIIKNLQKDNREISWTTIGNFILDGTDFFISGEVASQILQICNDRIRDEIQEE